MPEKRLKCAVDGRVTVRVGLGSCGISAGGREVYNALDQALRGARADLKQTGCMGICYREPLVEVANRQQSWIYGGVTPEKAARIVEEHVKNGKPVEEWLVLADGVDSPERKFMMKQKRVVLRNCGVIDPEDIGDYLAADGYKALEKVLGEMTPEQVIKEIIDSGLRGRGGAGFSTGMKWSFTRKSPATQKYIVCNADEGDPGAFMDRSVLESDTHSVLEGMMIGAYAIGASEGYMYVRAEYPLAVKRLKIAIAQAEERGYIGENIMGSPFSFRVIIREGAGAFVCGEETALLMSIEGKRGMPRSRPPFPAQSGLWGKPTCINNVETMANVPWIIRNGAKAFAGLGTDKSKGTKVFALAGKTARGGLVEVPMGITLNEIVYDIGGGTSTGMKFKAIQTGGPSGGCIPAHLADTVVDYDSLGAVGAIMGSGGMLVMDEGDCMVDVAKFFLNFTQDESCGKCSFCRLGTKRMLEILERITNGEGREGDIELLEELADSVKKGSLCGLGQTAPNPVLTTIRYFRDEYEAHIYGKKCPAKKCRALITFHVNAEKCAGCGLCAKYCPTKAIWGERKHPFVIAQDKCAHCGLCLSVCKLGAITVE